MVEISFSKKTLELELSFPVKPVPYCGTLLGSRVALQIDST